MPLTDEELGITPIGLPANPISGGFISDEDAALGITPLGSINDAHDAALGITPPGGAVTAFGSELGRGLVRGFFNVGGGLVGTAEWLIPGKQESLIEAKRKVESAKFDYSQEYGNWAGWAGRIIGEAFPYMGAAMVGGYAGAGIGGAVGGAGGVGAVGQAAIGAGVGAAKMAKVGAIIGAGSVAFAVEGQNAFDDAIATGASENEANAERLIIGTINAAIEAAQITRIMQFHKTGAGSLRSFIRNVRGRAWDLVKGDAKQFGGQVLNHALTEALEEAAQEGVSIAIPAALRGQVPRKPNGMVDWNQIINRVGFSAAAGGLVGGTLGGGGALVGASTEIGRPSNREIDKAIAAVDGYNIPKKQKELFKAQLEEGRVEMRFGEEGVEEPKAAEAIPRTPEGEIPAFNRQYDQDLVRFAQEIDTSRRAEHEAAIKKKKGTRIGAASKLLSDENISPDIRAYQARKLLAGELALRFPAQMKLNENQVSYYKQRILTSTLSEFDLLNADEGLNNLLIPNKDGNVKLPEPKQIEALEEVFGPEFAKVLHKLRAENVTLSKKVIDAMNLPRAVLASFDFSAAGRQGLMLLPIAPKQWFKAVKMGYRAWTSPEYAGFIDLQIKSHPMYKPFKKAGGFLSTMGSILKGEEVFVSELAHRIPGIPASERAYTTTLNALRFYTFVKYAEQWQGTGKSHEDYVMLAKFINHVTGRGSVKGLEKMMPAMNALFFAPRLTMGRIQALGDLFRGWRTIKKDGKIVKKGQLLRLREAEGTKAKWEAFSATRKIIAQDLMFFFVGGAGILGLLSLMKGVEVEDDPRSSDFGKVRFGNTRFDFWGGYSQIARLTAQLITAEAKGTETGRIMPTDRGQVISRYVQSKLSPASGLTVDLVRGETFIGEQLEATPEGITKQAFERFTPLFIQDVVDAARYQGLTTAGIVAPVAMHGIGAMTYPVRTSTEASRVKDMKSRQAYGVGWDEIGPLAQSYIRERNPDIELLERQARAERENFDMVARRLEEQHKVTKNIIKKLPVPIRNDIERLDVVIPGLSRYVSNGWYLNDKRYKAYQNEIRDSLTRYLTRLRNRPLWNRLPDSMKATLIEDVAKMVRDQTRSQLLMASQIEDFQRVTQ